MQEDGRGATVGEADRGFEEAIDRIQRRYGWSNEYVIGKRLAEGGDGLSYTELLQKIRVTREAVLEEKQLEAYWSWRAHPPIVGEGENRTVVPFKNWLASIGLGMEVEEKRFSLTDEDIKRAFSRGVTKIAVLPPGMQIKEK